MKPAVHIMISRRKLEEPTGIASRDKIFDNGLDNDPEEARSPFRVVL
jgi:hypothetical protein